MRDFDSRQSPSVPSLPPGVHLVSHDWSGTIPANSYQDFTWFSWVRFVASSTSESPITVAFSDGNGTPLFTLGPFVGSAEKLWPQPQIGFYDLAADKHLITNSGISDAEVTLTYYRFDGSVLIRLVSLVPPGTHEFTYMHPTDLVSVFSSWVPDSVQLYTDAIGPQEYKLGLPYYEYPIFSPPISGEFIFSNFMFESSKFHRFSHNVGVGISVSGCNETIFNSNYLDRNFKRRFSYFWTESRVIR